MRRILLGLGMIIFIGGAVAGATGAFFSDTETSAGNIFTAGSIDLKIDHSLSTYNGEPNGEDFTIVSDTLTTFTGDDGAGNAVAVTFIHPSWTADLDGGHVAGPPNDGANDGSFWIWAADGPSDASVTQTNTFTRTFNVNGPIVGATLYIAADNFYSVSLNGNAIGSEFAASNFTSAAEDVYVVPAADFVQGPNTLTAVVTNPGGGGGDPTFNPAGLLFKLVVDGDGIFVDPIDLTGEPFWNFTDVKPGDDGRDVFSLHVGTNDGWACMDITNVENDDNTCTEPESDALVPDAECNAASLVDLNNSPLGELGNYLNLFLWNDDGDGVYEPPTETSLSSGLFGNGITLPLHDSTTGNGALVASTTEYIGSAWCAGVQIVDGLTGVITCDGSTMGNEAQTDSLTADIVFRAEQVRHNPNFLCDPGDAPPPDPT
ncbi:MAG: Uncharacterized protein G01um10148_751 [Parcubacteria group bacterium Gr01-1014_8]|nr:MAG: Uncharacterized protein G01um10148_751 [Parcubacteria group bacterium Gr01-1014_8]